MPGQSVYTLDPGETVLFQLLTLVPNQLSPGVGGEETRVPTHSQCETGNGCRENVEFELDASPAPPPGPVTFM